MAKKSKLLAALDRHRGRDYDAEKRSAQAKKAEKRKQAIASKANENEPAMSVAIGQQKDNVAQTSDEPKIDVLAQQHSNGTETGGQQSDDGSASESEPESDVAVSDLDDEDLEDVVPHQRMTINNGPALLASRNRIALIKDPAAPFHLHNSLVSTLPPSSSSVPDANDDLTRELEFYRIAREATVKARVLLKRESIPFSRPSDYFAEMVKSDEHMGKIKKKMYDDAAAKMAAQEARKLRDAKKFGKAVQVAKEQERAKEKRNTLDRIKELKRKRKGQDTGKVREDDQDLFQSIDVEDNPSRDRSGRERGSAPNFKRQKRDQKYGFGGKKRFSKSGDAVSSGDMKGFSTSKMKGKSKRPGKSKRAAAR